MMNVDDGGCDDDDVVMMGDDGFGLSVERRKNPLDGNLLLPYRIPPLIAVVVFL